MRAALRFLLLALVLGAYVAQPLTTQHHLHEGGERAGCTACISQASPETTPPPRITAPAVFHASFGKIAARPLPPPAQLQPEDFSYSTSPPNA